MKNIIRSLITGILLLVASQASAMDSIQDPNGFADLRFGATVEDIKATHYTKFLGYQSGTSAFHIVVRDAHGSLYFSGTVIARGVFTDNRLSGVIIAFDKETIPERVAGLHRLLGEYEKSQGMYKWDGPFSTVIMTSMNGKGMLLVASKEYTK